MLFLDKFTNWLFRSIPANVSGPRYNVPTGRITGTFDAARVDRFGMSWGTTPLTPDELIRSYLRTLQARSRDAANNDPYMRRFVRACRANIVGTHGPKLRCAVRKGNDDHTKLSQAVTQSFQSWGQDYADYRGIQSFYSLTLSVISSLAIDGEAFIKKISDGPYGLQLQLIDAVRCPSDYDLDKPESKTYIRAGIEYDAFDRPLAYYFSSDGQHGNYYAYDGRVFNRIPAEEILHVYRKDFIGQKRGLPWAVASLYRLRHLKGFEENALTNAEIGASKSAVIEKNPDYAVDDGLNGDAGDDRYIQFTAEGGQILELEPGEKFTTWSPDFPDGSVGSFSTHLLHGISAGIGVMHSTISGDFSGVNYSSFRAGVQEERELWKEDQKLLIEEFVRPIFREWLQSALLRRMVVSDDGYRSPATKLETILRNTSFHGRRWDWVDPKSDAIANRTAVDTGIKTPQEIIRDQGRDPDETLLELANWYRKAEALGIPLEALQVAMGAQVKITEQTEESDDTTDNA